MTTACVNIISSSSHSSWKELSSRRRELHEWGLESLSSPHLTTSVVSYNALILTNPCVLVISSCDVPILLGLRKTANASPYQNLDSCQPATILCNSSIYFFLLTCFLFGRFSWVVTAQKFLSSSQTLVLGPDTCMRNELLEICGFVRNNSLSFCVILSSSSFNLFLFCLFIFCLSLLRLLAFRPFPLLSPCVFTSYKPMSSSSSSSGYASVTLAFLSLLFLLRLLLLVLHQSFVCFLSFYNYWCLVFCSCHFR